MVGVDPFVYALAEDHEVCDIFGFGDLLVLQMYSVEAAEEDVVYEAHFVRDFERFFGYLEVLEMVFGGGRGGREWLVYLLRGCRRRDESEWAINPWFGHDA